MTINARPRFKTLLAALFTLASFFALPSAWALTNPEVTIDGTSVTIGNANAGSWDNGGVAAASYQSGTITIPAQTGLDAGTIIKITSVSMGEATSNKGMPSRLKLAGAMSEEAAVTSGGFSAASADKYTYNFSNGICLLKVGTGSAVNWLNSDGTQISSGNINFRLAKEMSSSFHSSIKWSNSAILMEFVGEIVTGKINESVTNFSSQDSGEYYVSGVSGWLSTENNTTAELVLVDGTYGFGYKVVNANSPQNNDTYKNRGSVFSKLSGDGTLTVGSANNDTWPVVRVYDSSEFTGTINIDSTYNTQLNVVFCNENETLPDSLFNLFSYDNGKSMSLYVSAGRRSASGNAVTIPSGKTWTATRLVNCGDTIINGTFVGTVEASAGSTLDFSNNAGTPITGDLTVTATTKIILPAEPGAFTLCSGTLTVPATSVLVDNGNGTYSSYTYDTTAKTVTIAPAVATFNGTHYPTLGAALAAAGTVGSGTVTLLGSTGDSETAVTVPAGVTLNLDANTLTASTLIINGQVNATTANAISCTTLIGATTGVLAYTGYAPTTGNPSIFANNGWLGTVWIKGQTTGTLNGFAGEYGNAGSKVRFSGCSGYPNYNTTINSEVVFENGDYGYAFDFNNGWSFSTGASYYTIFSKISGSGNFFDSGSYPRQLYLIRDAVGFTGSITNTGKAILISSAGAKPATATSDYDGKITVAADGLATLGDGATWNSANGIFVNGTLAVKGEGTIASNTAFGEGATLRFDSTAACLTLGASVTATSQTVNIAFADGIAPAIGTERKVIATTADISNITFNVPGENFIAVRKNDGLYVTYAAAQVGDTVYASLADAVEAVTEDGGTVALLSAPTAASVTSLAIPAGVTVDLNGKSLAGVTVTGLGTVLSSGAAPTGIYTSSDWRGTVWIKNTTMNNFNPDSYGNANSVVRLSGVTGYGPKEKQTVATTIELDNDDYAFAYQLSDGFSFNAIGGYAHTVFSKLIGGGTLKCNSKGDTVLMVVVDGSEFSGSFDMSNKVVYFDSAAPADGTALTAGTIVVKSGADVSVAPGATWNATGGVTIDGPINVTNVNELTSGMTLVESTGDIALGANAALKLNGAAVSSEDWLLLVDRHYLKVISAGVHFEGDALVADDSLAVALSSYDVSYDGNGETITKTAKAGTSGVITVTGGALKVDGTSHLPGSITIGESATLKVETVANAKAAAIRLSIDNNAAITVNGTVQLNGVAVTGYTVEDGYIFIGPETVILPWGDSITEGGGTSPSVAGVTTLANKSNYRTLLMEKLGKNGYNPRTTGFWDVKGWMKDGSDAPHRWRWHSGMYGHTAAQWTNHAGELDAADAILDAARCEPDVVTFNLGINDLSFSHGAANVFIAWTNLIERIHTLSPSTKIVATQLMDAKFDRAGSVVENFNQLAVAWAATQTAADWNVSLVNLHDAVPLNDDNFHGDLVHPNWQGQTLSANEWFDGVTNVLEYSGKKGVSMAPLSAANDLTLEAGNKVYVTFTRPVKPSSVAGSTATLSGAGAPTLSNPTLQSDGRTVAYTASAALTAGTEYTVSVTRITDYDDRATSGTATFTVATYGAEANVPEEYRAGMKKYLTSDLPASGIGGITYTTNAVPPQTVSKMGYYLELERPDTHKIRYVWVDMTPPAEQTALNGLLVPTASHFQKVVDNLHVYSNSRNIQTVAWNDDTVKGVMEFTYHGVTPADSATPNMPDGAVGNNTVKFYDWNDTLNEGYSYGFMQIHRITPTSGYGRHYVSGGNLVENTAEVLFAFNSWNVNHTENNANEIGIGNFAQHILDSNNVKASGSGETYDYTFTYWLTNMNATAYTVRRMEFWAVPPTVRYDVTESNDCSASIATDVAARVYAYGDAEVTVDFLDDAPLALPDAALSFASLDVTGTGTFVFQSGTTLSGGVVAVAADATVKMAFANGVPASNRRLIGWTAEPEGSFAFADESLAKVWKLKKKADGLYAVRRPFMVILR